MRASFKRLAVFGLLGLSVFVVGQAGGPCGASPFNDGGDTGGSGSEPDPLAPLVGDPDPLAPLVPTPARGACGLWVGTLVGTEHEVKAKHYECPWQGGGSSVTDENEDEIHESHFDVTFPDAWAADSSRCAPSGVDAKALSSRGTVQYKRAWTENYEYGDTCGRYHKDTVDETFTFSVKPQDIKMSVAVDAGTYTEQQAILAERPCRTEYPVRLQIQVSAPDTGGSGTFTSTETSKPCDLPAGTTTDSHAVTENYAASVIVILYGTYHVSTDGSDTIEAKCRIPLPANPASQVCAGVSEDCPSQCSDAVAQEYTLSLTRFPEGDRDLDGECDSVDPCPDAAFENECDSSPWSN